MEVAFAVVEAKDGVSDQLTWSVISDVAPAIALDEVDSVLGKLRFVKEQVLNGIFAGAEGIDGVMFGEDQCFRMFAFTDLGEQLQLAVPCLLIASLAPINSVSHTENVFVSDRMARVQCFMIYGRGSVLNTPGMKHRFITVATLFLTTLFSACVKESTVEDGVLRLGNGGEPRDLDPHTVTGVPEVTIISALMEGLVTFHPETDQIPYPGVAESWEVSEDGRTWTFRLRENARWSNGDPVTADDFVYGWHRVLMPELGNEYADWMYIIKGAEAFHKGENSDPDSVGIRAPDPRTLVVELRQPVAEFLQVLLNHTFSAVHRPTIEAHGGPGVRSSGWTSPDSYVGNGAFRLVKWEPNSVIRVEPNPYYWDAGAVRLKAIEFYPIEDENTELRAFESGQLDVTSSVPVGMRDHYAQNYPEQIRFDPYAGVYYLKLNTTHSPLEDVRVREALSLSIDRKRIVESILRGGERVAYGFVPAGLSGYEPEKRTVYDPERARELLAEAGYPAGEGFPVVEYLYNTSDNHRKIAEAIQGMWREELGVDISLANKEWKVYLDTTNNMNYDISRAGWVGSLYPFSFLQNLLSVSANNETGYKDPEYDSLLYGSIGEFDAETRYAMLREAESRMLNSFPVVPLYWYTNTYLINPRVRNWNPKLVDQRPFKLVYLEESD